MKRLFFFFSIIVTTSTAALAQDSMTPKMAVPPRSAYGDGGGAEVFVTAFALLPTQATGNGISEQATKAGGGSAGYRFHLRPSSALEGRYGFSRNSQKYTIGDTVYSIPVYQSEISGSYVYTFGKTHRVQPFLLGGGGILLFSPTNYDGTADSSVNAASPAYGGSSIGATPAYGGSSIGLPRQAKPMFLFGAGADLPMSSRLNFRVEFRALGSKTPDFGVTALQTGSFAFI